METFTITVKEVLERKVEIEAENIHSATVKAQYQYENKEIVLNTEDAINLIISGRDKEGESSELDISI
ncbi:DpnD/PcfM family protein [Psychrobacter celer]|uniref:DpnD/PcfM family protein n=1 Tax=Psychrobacter celer TaxID=306572 RepID=UPI003FD19B16